VDIETSYGPDHEVLAERYRIVDIVEVLPPTRGEAVAATPRADMEPHRLHAPELEEAAS
jgi:hypothetical protein